MFFIIVDHSLGFGVDEDVFAEEEGVDGFGGLPPVHLAACCWIVCEGKPLRQIGQFAKCDDGFEGGAIAIFTFFWGGSQGGAGGGEEPPESNIEAASGRTSSSFVVADLALLTALFASR